MEQTTQSPPTRDEKTEAEKPANTTKPLPATEEDFRSGRSRTQSSGFRIGVGIAIIVLLIAGFFAYRYFTSYESTDDAEVDGHINPISARISGHVVKLNVDDNQYVQAGTVLVEIDPTDYQVAYDRAKAEYENAQAAALAAGWHSGCEATVRSSQGTTARG
jgi:membrane fusion protein (multidrug efflux system)